MSSWRMLIRMVMVILAGVSLSPTCLPQEVDVPRWSRSDVVRAMNCYDGDPGEFNALLFRHLGVGNMAWHHGGRLGPYSAQVRAKDDVGFIPRWRDVVSVGKPALIRAPGRDRIGLSPIEGDIPCELEYSRVYHLDTNGNKPPSSMGGDGKNACDDGLVLIVASKRILLVAVERWSVRSPRGDMVVLRPGTVVILQDSGVLGREVDLTSSGKQLDWSSLAYSASDKARVLELGEAASRFLSPKRTDAEASQFMAAVMIYSGIKVCGDGAVSSAGGRVDIGQKPSGGGVVSRDGRSRIAYVKTADRRVYVDVGTGECMIELVSVENRPR